MSPFLKLLKKSMVPQLCFAITFLTSGLIINLVQCILYFCLRPANKSLYRTINWYLCYMIYSQLVCLAEWWAGMKLIVYTNKNDFDNAYQGHAVCIMNHTYEIDWLLALILSDRTHTLGNTKAYVKKSLQYLPVIGWSWKFSDYVMLERSFKKDQLIIKEQLKELVSYSDSIMLLLYLEGTRFTPEKHKTSEEFAQQHNMAKLKYHLQPRTRGFTASIPCLKGKVPAVYDIILAFKDDAKVQPSMMNIIMGEQITAYLYIKRIPMENVPSSEEELKKFCQDVYVRKDKLKDSFVKTGDFFATSGVAAEEDIQSERRYYSLINTIIWAVLCPIGYYIICLLISGNLVYSSFGIGIIAMFVGIVYMFLGATKKTKSSTYGIVS